MRTEFVKLLTKDGAAQVDDDNWTDQFLYMSLWYACLYVLIEGWLQLKLSDPEVDALLESPNVDLLERFRNGVFHYQRDYWDERWSTS